MLLCTSTVTLSGVRNGCGSISMYLSEVFHDLLTLLLSLPDQLLMDERDCFQGEEYE